MKPAIAPVSFRPDIQGLRAWAVIAVLLFHFNLPGASSGFIGVDIFFVVSGFLMASIIVKGLEKKNFSIWQFYISRIRRIVPALMVLLVVLLVLGWFLLPTPDYKSLGAQSASSLGFLSNIYYWRTASYFGATAHEKWLLHTWSLGIEFQFYVLFPVFMLLLWKIKPKIKTLFWGLGGGFAVSLALSIVASSWQPTAAFYLLPTRGWELAAGGLAFLIGREVPSLQRFAKPMFWTGFTLWVVAALFIDNSLAWPSGWALFPVMGTALIIIAQQTNVKLMVNPLAQWLGNRSYSLYLWHWPLVVALYFTGLHTDWLWITAAFALSLLFGDLSYRLIETPTRKYLTAASFAKQGSVFAVTSLVIVLSAVSVNVFDLKFRGMNQSEKDQYLVHYSREKFVPLIREDYLEQCNFFDDISGTAKKHINANCTSKEGDGGVFLWGDSHAQALSFGLRKLLKENYQNTPFYQVASSGCRAHLTPDTQTSGEFKISCDRSNAYVLEKIKMLQPDLVIIAQQNRHDKNNFEDISNKLLSFGVKQVFVVGPVPEWEPTLPKIIARRHWQDDNKIEDVSFVKSLRDMDQQLVKKFDDSRNFKYFSVMSELCDGYKCLAKLDEDRTPLVFDYGHLSPAGSSYVVKNVLALPIDQVLTDQEHKPIAAAHLAP
ncbi:acyltransferase family protein [Phytohalomonas tamaricis]|uniref:acyltransferase family protein n=1 Tax=Phytohalomonas tamaricis TaxID=2081032 RepID=UPI000D0BD977|nr:acyltransferase family protein [Phytohalomonas tamaricis]